MTRRHFKTETTKRDTCTKAAPDLVDRDFSAEGSDQLWVADIMYVRTWAGSLHLTVVLDAWSRRSVGRAMASRMPAGLVGDAYDNALCESFFATPECGLLDRPSFRTVADSRREVFSFIAVFHNTRWLHSVLGYESPANFETLNHAA